MTNTATLITSHRIQIIAAKIKYILRTKQTKNY